MKLIDLPKINAERLATRRSLINRINPLVQIAFGQGFRGDYKCEYEGFSWGDELAFIAKRKKRNFWEKLRFVQHPFINHLIEAGNFYKNSSGKGLKPDERDGSVIKVKPEYVPNAKEYAKLYEREFGREVTIIIDNSI